MPDDEGFSKPLAGDALSCFSLAPFVSDGRNARPSTSPTQLSPGVRLSNRHGDLYFRGQLCSNDAEKANKDSRSRESELKKECFYRESLRHHNYLPEPAIFRHSKLTL